MTHPPGKRPCCLFHDANRMSMKFASTFFREIRIRETTLILAVSLVLSSLAVRGESFPLDSDPTCCLAGPLGERLAGCVGETPSRLLALFQPPMANLSKAERLQDFAPTSRSAERGDDSNEIAESRPPNQTDSRNRQFRWLHLFQLAIVAALTFWGYSLVMSGRQGFGWKTLLVIGTLFAGMMRFAGSLFNEVSASNEVGDWDDDSEPNT